MKNTKSTKQRTHAAAGGSLKGQLDQRRIYEKWPRSGSRNNAPRVPNDDLARKIAQFSPPEERERLNTRLRGAIERVRWHICGVFGVKAQVVCDGHVAEFLDRIDSEYLRHSIPGIGFETESELTSWGNRELMRR